MSHTANPVDLGDRTAFWLRSSGYSAKQVARLLGASEATGKRLRSGAAPTTEQITRLARHFGWPFVRHVFSAVLGPDDAELAIDLDDIKRRLARLECCDELDRADDATPASGRSAVACAPRRMVVGVASQTG